MAEIEIDPLSCVPLHLETFWDTSPGAYGTGFLVKKDSAFFLITNYHVLSGRNSVTNQPLSKTGLVPNKLKVWFHHKDKLGIWVSGECDLSLQGNKQVWSEIKIDEKYYDVVALPIDIPDRAKAYCLDLSTADTDLLIFPSEPVSIIGFPGGRAVAGKFPIWKTGHVASDIGIDYDGKPVFLIDATTKPGMSGSPVIAKRSGGYRSSKGYMIGGGSVTKFMGVYSGRIPEDESVDTNSWSVGMVWKPSVVKDLIKIATAPTP